MNFQMEVCFSNGGLENFQIVGQLTESTVSPGF